MAGTLVPAGPRNARARRLPLAQPRLRFARHVLHYASWAGAEWGAPGTRERVATALSAAVGSPSDRLPATETEADDTAVLAEGATETWDFAYDA